jgi:6-phosphogluconate dehydrogenase
MKVGFIGLGRMGENLVLNLRDHGHKPVVYNRTESKTKKFVNKNKTVEGVYSISDLVKVLPKRKIIWIMITAGKPVDATIDSLIPYLSKGDIVIDGGNSYYKDSIKRYNMLKKKGIHFLDVGTSGGIEGARNGACMMVGGDMKAYEIMKKVFSDSCVKDGSGYMGKSGSGHFVKMVHNGIEYGMMGAIAEGMDVIRKNSKKFGTDLEKVAKVYSNGSIIESHLVKWMHEGMNSGYFNDLSGEVAKGETEEEMRLLLKGSDMTVLRAALDQRKSTRKKPSYRGKLVSTMRYEFGGHKFKRKKK